MKICVEQQQQIIVGKGQDAAQRVEGKRWVGRGEYLFWGGHKLRLASSYRGVFQTPFPIGQKFLANK